MSHRKLISRISSLALFWAAMSGALSADANGDDTLVLRGELSHVDSPAGTMRVTLTQWDSPAGSESSSRQESAELRWRVDRIVDGRAQENLLPDAPLTRHPAVRRATPAKLMEDRYEAVHGKRKRCGGRYREVNIQNLVGDADRPPHTITLRVYDDGVAWRYHKPPRGDVGPAPAAWTFAVSSGATAWIAPYDRSGQWTPAYEVYYEAGINAGQASPNSEGWAFPALFELADKRGWALVTESAVPQDYCGTRFEAKPVTTAGGKQYKLRFPGSDEGLGQGDAQPSGETTPWYVVVLGPTPAAIVESTLVQDLNSPCKIDDVSWIRPGRAAWSWWSDSNSSKSFKKQLPFIDLAAEMGWEYYLVDANWDLMPDGDIPQMVEYAGKKGVGLLLWYNSGGPNNKVTERPRDRMFDRQTRRAEMKKLAAMGVKGLKIDFWHSDKEDTMQRYQQTLQDAAEFNLVVNFHGCTIPRGWSRTWPNLVTMESVKGAECYKFAGGYEAKAPSQNTILAFTRNAIGPMDYTPVTFTRSKHPRRTTVAHELALAVLFESGIQHMADKVSAYRDLPEAPKSLLKKVPTAWDDTRYLAGRPGEFVILARRKGRSWYIAGINGTDQPLDVAIDLTPLGERGGDEANGDEATVSFITDDQSGEGWQVSDRLTTEIKLLPRGGFVQTIGR